MILSIEYENSEEKGADRRTLPYVRRVPEKRRVEERRAKVYGTKLDIPFIESPAMGNGYGLDEVLELVFSDGATVKSVNAFIDKKSVKVFEYRYPSNPEMKTFYIELTGEVRSGSSPYLSWKSNGTKRRKKERIRMKRRNSAHR